MSRQICLNCCDDARFCRCDLSYPEELLSELTNNYNNFSHADSKLYLTTYKGLVIRKGRAVYISPGSKITAITKGKRYNVSFIDIFLHKVFGVDFEIDGTRFSAKESVPEEETSNVVCKDQLNNVNFDDFDTTPKVMGIKIKNLETALPTVIEISRTCKDKKRFVEDISLLCKETISTIDRQVEIDSIKDFYFTGILCYKSAFVLLVSYLKNASVVSDQYDIPLIMDEKTVVAFQSKTLQELKGIMILGADNIICGLDDFYKDMHIKIGNRFAVEIIAQQICNAARSDGLYKEIMKL